jgi:tetratricopeptide (TPR) repeat protein
MKKNIILPLVFQLIVIFLLTSCGEKAKPGADRENNDFFAEYRNIYRDYGRQPLDSTRLRLQAFLEEFPNDAKAWVFYGRVCYDLGQETDAQRAYERALNENPKYALAYTSLGSLAFRQGDVLRADSLLGRAIQLGDSSPVTLVNIGLIRSDKLGSSGLDSLADLSMQYNTRRYPESFAGSACLYYLAVQQAKAASAADSAFRAGLTDTLALRKVLLGQTPAREYLLRLR